MAGGAGKTAVASDERRVEGFGERDRDGDISRQIGAQLPHAWQDDFVRIGISGIFERLPASFRAHMAGQSVAAQHMGDLNVDELRRMEPFVRAE